MRMSHVSLTHKRRAALKAMGHEISPAEIKQMLAQVMDVCVCVCVCVTNIYIYVYMYLYIYI